MRRLYHFPLSPFCRKVRLALAEKRLEADLYEERPWDRRREFLLLNPGAETPVLVEPDRTVVCDSNAICEYLEEVYPQTPLLPGDPRQRAEIRRLVAWFDVKFHNEVTVNLLYERVQKRLRGEGQPDSTFVRSGAYNIRQHLDYIVWLTERRNWLAGDEISLADFAAAAHLSCLDYIGVAPWDYADGARDWYARIKSRPAFRTLLADHLPGSPPPPHYADLDF